MNRASFLTAAAAAPLAAGALRAAGRPGESAIPAELRGGRLFALPRTPGGKTFACWLDTSGGGFIFDWAVEAFGLDAGPAKDGGRSAALPAFDPAWSVPPPGGDGRLPVFDRSRADRHDPILQGFAAQLGATWFLDRTWRLDYAAGTLATGVPPLTAAETTAGISFDRVYPQVAARIGGETTIVAFDTAASIAYGAAYAAGGAAVQATSFVTRDRFETWHERHPEWKVDFGVGNGSGFDRIVVDEVGLGTAVLRNVAFTTRPGDDVFQGEPTQVKLGANAYGDRIVVLDYPNGRLKL